MTRQCANQPRCRRDAIHNWAYCDLCLGRVVTAVWGPLPTVRAVVERLSASDPMCQAIEAEKRGVRAAA